MNMSANGPCCQYNLARRKGPGMAAGPRGLRFFGWCYWPN